MDTISAITGIIAGIAAQGAVTVTIPNDSELARELGPVEITRQLGPIKLRVHTAPAKNKAQAAPAEIKSEVAPAKTKSDAAPAEVGEQTPPAKAKSQPAPAKVASQTPPAEISNQEAPAQETGYAGLWYDHSGRSAIKITNCGKSLCGRIAWLKNTTHKSVCGTNIIGDVKKVGSTYDNGWIYDIERGKKFDVELKLVNENKLRVKGYAGTKLFSKTFVWKRAPSDLVLCS